MNSSFETKTTNVFGVAGNFWLLFMVIAVIFWLCPFFDAQQNSLLKTTALGAVAFLVGLLLRFSYHGVEIDDAKKRVREYTSFLGFKTGDWEPLPNVKKLHFASFNSSSWNTSNGISSTFRSTSILYKITLVSDTPQSHYSISLTDRKQALKNVQALADLFHLPVEKPDDI